MTFKCSFFCAGIMTLIMCAMNGHCDERQAQSLVVINGASSFATLDALEPDWTLRVTVGGEQKELTKNDYTRWGAHADQTRSPQILLNDGSQLVGEIVRIESEAISLASRLWGEVKIDRRLVRAWFTLPRSDSLERDREIFSLLGNETVDRVLLWDDDAISGRLLPTTDRDGGGLFGLVSLAIQRSVDGPRSVINLEDIRAITFDASPQPSGRESCVTGFDDGSLVFASSFTKTEAGIGQITSVAGVPLQLEADELLSHLRFVQPRNDVVTYLSDLPAIGYKSLPFLDLKWPLGVGVNTHGGRLRSGGTIAFKGLGMHSTSRVVYNLDRKYRRFQAELALDDLAADQGSVVFRVLAERDNDVGKREWALAFTSSIIRGNDAPLPIDLDVTGSARLALLVEMADRADTRDDANWLNARLIR